MAWFYFWRNPNFLLVVDDKSSEGTKERDFCDLGNDEGVAGPKSLVGSR